MFHANLKIAIQALTLISTVMYYYKSKKPLK